MTLKAKADSSYYDKSHLYAWIFINGVMIIEDEETYNFTIKQESNHRASYFETELCNQKKEQNGNKNNENTNHENTNN